MGDLAQGSVLDRLQVTDPGSILGEQTPERDVEMTDEAPSSWIIAFDFGTTFSSVAYARVSQSTRGTALSLMEVKCIDGYPDDRPLPGITFTHTLKPDVPSELWYGPESLPPEDEPEDQDVMDTDSRSDTPHSGSENEDNLDNHQEQEWRKSDTLYWGFEVQKKLKEIDIPKDGTKRITRFKLILDKKNELTSHVREEIGPILKHLKKSKLIKNDSDIISDYLTQLFVHTKNTLQQRDDFNATSLTEIVLCVPATWPAEACRVMQTAMSIAAKNSGLGKLENGSLSNIFIVSEPEAAAACVLAEHSQSIIPGETVVVVDAGGGTVDAITYEVSRAYPLRFSSEVVTPGSRLCGASYINERLQKYLLEKLCREKYLVKNGKTIESIVGGKVVEFEIGEKRIFDSTDENSVISPIYIDDLKFQPRKGFQRNKLPISHKKMASFFQESLDGAAAVLREQLELAKLKSCSVQKVILTGGFGQSPSLQNYLRKVVADETNLQGRDIIFLTPCISTTAVARGAVLRAFNKDLGPERNTMCSYGFLRTELYDETLDAHRNTRYTIDKADGEKYINGTIHWLIKKNTLLPLNKEFSIQMKHTFRPSRTRLICKEELYVSDNWHESHYRKGHAMNKGAELAGTIIADMTFLKTQGLIQPQPPSQWSTYAHSEGDTYTYLRGTHYAVIFDLVMIVNGRNLRYEVRWPSMGDVETFSQHPSVQAQGQINIAAAFKPGTA